MKSLILALACAAVALPLMNTASCAQDSCTWSRQTDGSQFGVCVDNAGRNYCMSRSGNNCSRVSCS